MTVVDAQFVRSEENVDVGRFGVSYRVLNGNGGPPIIIDEARLRQYPRIGAERFKRRPDPIDFTFRRSIFDNHAGGAMHINLGVAQRAS